MIYAISTIERVGMYHEYVSYKIKIVSYICNDEYT